MVLFRYTQMNTFTTYILTASMVFLYHFPPVSSNECPLDMKTPSSWNNKEETNWPGFLKNETCGLPFEAYLYGVSKQTNKTGEIFLNITDQIDCLSIFNNTAQRDVFKCGIQRLSSGNGGCSDYSVNDVVLKLGSSLMDLDDNCGNLGAKSGSDEDECESCAKNWAKMSGLGDECRFSVLVSLISRRVNDSGWVGSVFTCLGNGVPSDDEASEEKKIKLVRGLEILIGGVGSISVMIAVVWLILVRKKKKTKLRKGMDVTAPDKSLASGVSSNIKISLKEVHLATDNLSASNFIGQGIAGKVYKGILSNGTQVAIKHIINDGHMETFVREVTSLSHVKHPNLVELLGHCDGQDESFLVYELCDKGNLSEWLFGKHKFLTWTQRLEIAIDSARGLWFLHMYREGCIVHRDIKPTNILLGGNLEAKLSDFGLSKVIMNMGLSYVSSEVRGTFGYVDPEYQKNHHVHSSTDVYSFGIVLLQLLSGQRVINLDVTRPVPLSKTARNLTKGGDITEFADPKLNGLYSVEAFQLIFKLALLCTGLKQQRPSMEKVVVVLEKALSISERVKSVDFSLHST